jgi:hypothetical protein
MDIATVAEYKNVISSHGGLLTSPVLDRTR